MGMLIVIAGTPGTGKSTIGELLSSKCGLPVINLSTLAIEKGLIAYYDENRQTYVVDEEKLARYVSALAVGSEEDVVILTHYPELLPNELVKVVFVLRTHPLELEKRLRSRGWNEKKVNENVMAEILGVVSYNAIEAFGPERVREIDTTSTKPEAVAEHICRIIKGELEAPTGHGIDWLSEIPPEVLARFESHEGCCE